MTGSGIGAEVMVSGWRCLSLSSLWIRVCVFFLSLNIVLNVPWYDVKEISL